MFYPGAWTDQRTELPGGSTGAVQKWSARLLKLSGPICVMMKIYIFHVMAGKESWSP